MTDSMETRLAQIEQAIQPRRDALLSHPIYEQLTDVDALRNFMQRHVFAVWDFMSLLKALQREATCVHVPWTPRADGASCRLINEIVLGEECDEDGRGGYCSHFELYLDAMRDVGANVEPVEAFIHMVADGIDVVSAGLHAALPPSVDQFLMQTFALIDSRNPAVIAAGFTFGREDLLPGVFQKLVERINIESHGKADRFLYYLHRHIELDGDQHGPLSRRLLGQICGADDAKWNAAQHAAEMALDARLELWNGMVSGH
ncbi:DUF3050 domain-containing protein [Blastopirellula sp. J2-11]|uniref:DUF3050 domain-containing protein n=1 Tax=Blastopirellula sp. J2-11 TaxID=2943192 RepID=UPI0021C90F84|nr:DUF3050 domain-containing protein [Blastopirellula sp. J2-11]UUO07089.1 DUF3050 domain-containing protein [Blastopirellula sp. J2-11]